MEIDGHPTQDMIEELERRGAFRIEGSSDGPSPESVRFISERMGETNGFWLFLPFDTFMTGFDDIPS